jgi:hypothetical protein
MIRLVVDIIILFVYWTKSYGACCNKIRQSEHLVLVLPKISWITKNNINIVNVGLTNFQIKKNY